MSELTIQPTNKFIKAGLILTAVVFLALEIAYLVFWRDIVPLPVALVPPLLFAWPGVRALRRRFSRAVVEGDHLRYESGVMTRSTRNIQLTKIQDVRVDQRLMQRIWNVGDISIETAGEASRLTIPNVDQPQALANRIIGLAHKDG